ncbi:hypothetical protein CRE_02597 [Caenorhabditis remanei]|uniref:Uncharacterized protein n=1 Tax=Caenorhabditis remanei TaxID=31234 RepID=E3N9U8_CAERE|nr:hypothetical protein CRE_02597 [Caenorhabditis remanei]
MTLFVSVYPAVSIFQLLVGNRFVFSTDPQISKISQQLKFISQYDYPQIIYLALLILIAVPRIANAIKAPDEPQRLEKHKKWMVYVVNYGIFQAVFCIFMSFLYDADDETRYIITTVSQLPTVILIACFGLPYFFTCVIDYNWPIIAALIATILTSFPLIHFQPNCYAFLIVPWCFMIYFGLLELYLMHVDRIYDGLFHEINRLELDPLE